jgi:hypothetical protein
MNDKPNWIDRLWRNPHDRVAKEELHNLWLRFQADRKEAWDQLRILVTTSDKLREAARCQIALALDSPNRQTIAQLAVEALDEAEKMLSDQRWRLPASTPGVFIPYLREKNKLGRHHWIQRVLSGHFQDLSQPGEREQQLEEGDQ